MLRCVGQAHIPPILDKSYLCPTNLGFSAYSLSACSKNKWQGYSNAYLASKRICSQQAWWSCLPSPPAAKSGEAFPWIILLNEEIRLWCSTFWYKGCVLEDFLLRFSKDSLPLPPTLPPLIHYLIMIQRQMPSFTWLTPHHSGLGWKVISKGFFPTTLSNISPTSPPHGIQPPVHNPDCTHFLSPYAVLLSSRLTWYLFVLSPSPRTSALWEQVHACLCTLVSLALGTLHTNGYSANVEWMNESIKASEL